MFLKSGNPSYLAPEVLQGQEHSIQSDLWSMGILLYEMYTGHPPFVANSFKQLLDKIINSDMPPPKVKGSTLVSVVFFWACEMENISFCRCSCDWKSFT